jgi:hypothetical protein
MIFIICDDCSARRNAIYKTLNKHAIEIIAIVMSERKPICRIMKLEMGWEGCCYIEFL